MPVGGSEGGRRVEKHFGRTWEPQVAIITTFSVRWVTPETRVTGVWIEAREFISWERIVSLRIGGLGPTPTDGRVCLRGLFHVFPMRIDLAQTPVFAITGYHGCCRTRESVQKSLSSSRCEAHRRSHVV